MNVRYSGPAILNVRTADGKRDVSPYLFSTFRFGLRRLPALFPFVTTFFPRTSRYNYLLISARIYLPLAVSKLFYIASAYKFPRRVRRSIIQIFEPPVLTSLGATILYRPSSIGDWTGLLAFKSKIRFRFE